MFSGAFLAAAAAAAVAFTTYFPSAEAGIAYPFLKTLDMSGANYSAYAIGLTQGSAFMSSIKDALLHDDVVMNQLLPYVQSGNGKSAFDELKANHQVWFPDFWSELRGLADGADVSFELVLLSSFVNELYHTMRPNDSLPLPRFLQCSDVLLSHAMGHNEDANIRVKTDGYLLSAPDADGMRYYAYTYPGNLPGLAFNWNSAGIAFTANAVFPQEVFLSGVGRYWLTRDLLRSTSIADVLNRTSNLPAAYGVSLNVASLKENRVLNLEIAPGMFPKGGRVTVTEVSESTPVVPHFNMYLYNSEVPQIVDPSSEHRLATFKGFGPIKGLGDIKSFLSDRTDPAYPVYRNGAPPDTIATAATALFNITSATVEVYVQAAAQSHFVAIHNMTDIWTA